MQGDSGVLFSNIMHWLTNRELPPPPSVVELGQKINEMNMSLDVLYSRMLQLKNALDDLNQQIPQLNDVRDQLNAFNQTLQTLSAQIRNLSNQQTQNQTRDPAQDFPTYLTIIAIVLSLAAITISLKKK